jgi:hypothetical protein
MIFFCMKKHIFESTKIVIGIRGQIEKVDH